MPSFVGRGGARGRSPSRWPRRCAELFTNHRQADAGAVADYIRVLAVFLPLSSAYTVAIAATRGFGTMVPNALVDRIGKAAVQTARGRRGRPRRRRQRRRRGRLGRCRSGSRSRSRCCGSAGWCAGSSGASRPTKPATPLRRLAREFWVFTAPRGLTGVFQVTTLWVGTLMVGSLMDTAHASIYTASTRYLVAGQRGQHGHHPGDRAEALRAARQAAPGSGRWTSTRWRRRG